MATPANSRPASQKRTRTQLADRLHEWYTLEDHPSAQSHSRAQSSRGWTVELSTRGESMGVHALTRSPTPELRMATLKASATTQPVVGRSAKAHQAASEDDPRGGTCLGHSAVLPWPQPIVQSVMPAGALQQPSQQHQQTDDSDILSFLVGSRPERTPDTGGPRSIGGSSTLARVALSLSAFGLGVGSKKFLPAASSGMQPIPVRTVGSSVPATASSMQDHLKKCRATQKSSPSM